MPNYRRFHRRHVGVSMHLLGLWAAIKHKEVNKEVSLRIMPNVTDGSEEIKMTLSLAFLLYHLWLLCRSEDEIGTCYNTYPREISEETGSIKQ